MAQLVRDPSTKPVNLSSILRVHMEGKNQLPQSSVIKELITTTDLDIKKTNDTI